MDDIYSRIWDADGARVPVAVRGGDSSFDPAASVHVDEQTGSDGCTSEDAVTRPLLAHVDEGLFDQPTFRTFIALLDNFTALEGRTERDLSDPVHGREIEAFLDAVFATPALALALEHVQAQIEPGLDEDEFRRRVRRAWFEPYTNHFSGPAPFAVGFEHVFVGEDESRGTPPSPCRDAVGGYHSWVKYYLDQKAGRVTYLGHDYEPPVAARGLADGQVSTLVMTWRVPEPDGGSGLELLKKPGGFFLGTRPECEIALGTVALFEVLAGRFQNGHPQENHRRVKLGDNFFDLVCHPQTVRRNPKELGPRIRTFYAKFRGAQETPGDISAGGGVSDGAGGAQDLPTQPHNSGPVRIFRALPNPVEAGDVGEWVELRNASVEAVSLSAWRLLDQEGRAHSLMGILVPGETRRFVTRTDNEEGPQLRNSGGWILLFEGDQRRAAVRYTRAAQGEIKAFE